VIRPFEERDVAWAENLIGASLGGRLQARLGSVVDALTCRGLIAEVDGEPVGLITFQQDGTDVEIVYVEVATTQHGVGTRLIDAVVEVTHAERLWLVTTNDNVDALRFYQRSGFRISEVRTGAVDDARRLLKPSIPSIGASGIPIRDEIVLERAQARPCS
jgi:ribosomal protein S18 acetylase RimI-like enzyme